MLDELMILTPEKTVVSFRYATIGSRIIAQVIDLMIIICMMIGFDILLNMHFMPKVIRDTIAYPGFILIGFGYFILLEGLWNGFTIGKRILNIRVVMIDGTPITFLAALGRNILRLADLLPSFYFLGATSMYISKQSQRLGDMISQTIVIHNSLPSLTGYIQAPHHAGVHPYEVYVGSLKGMTSEDYNALRRLCDRFPELPAKIQDKLIQEVWNPFAENHGIRPIQGLHPLYLAEATVMKYGREKGLL